MTTMTAMVNMSDNSSLTFHLGCHPAKMAGMIPNDHTEKSSKIPRLQMVLSYNQILNVRSELDWESSPHEGIYLSPFMPGNP